MGLCVALVLLLRDETSEDVSTSGGIVASMYTETVRISRAWRRAYVGATEARRDAGVDLRRVLSVERARGGGPE
jgi:hypothetical protein